MSQIPLHKCVARNTLMWLLIAQAVALLPLFWLLPLWIPMLWLFTLTWRIQIFRGAWSFPSNRLKILVGLVSIIGLVISYAGTIGVEPLVAFLVVSFVLKLIEVKSRNDVLLVVYVGFITVAAQFLFFQTVFIAIYGGVSVVVLLSAWNGVYCSRVLSAKKQLSTGIVIFMQSVPLMLVLFVILPRLGTLWHVPIPRSTGVTGFSDSMAPGDFTSLSQSRAVVFRVSFDSNDTGVSIPPRSGWYWRGLVLDKFNGRRWSHRDSSFFRRSTNSNSAPDFWQVETNSDAEYFRYTVLMEPHQQRWLFTMMAPVSVISSSEKIFFSRDFITKSAKPIASRMQYRVISTGDFLASSTEISASDKRRNLQLPPGSNPRARDLVHQWQAQGFDGRALVSKTLDMFNTSFTYTLQPPPLGTHSVDEFLFNTRRGFCEHFASSFVVLMRAAGIPARVVVGYQGGEFNDIENYIIVRQSDAHAWTEIWLPEAGWVRVDPTAAVSPLRIERGLEESLAENEKRLVRGFFSAGILGYLQLHFDAFNYSWQRWVLGYDSRKQANIFRQLFGGFQAWRIGGIFVGLVTAILFLYFLLLTRSGRAHFLYPEQALYAQLIKRLNKHGYTPEKGETPVSFVRRVVDSEKRWSQQLLEIAQLYNRVAYENRSSLVPMLRQKIREFKFE